MMLHTKDQGSRPFVFFKVFIFCSKFVLFDFSHTVKAEPHECVIRTGQP